MFTRLGAALALAILTIGLMAPATAEARGGIAVISTGDKMFDIADAAAGSPARETWSDAVVAYHSQHFGIFWLPIWTWDGKFVVYSDSIDTYQDGTVEELSEITGVPVDQFQKPLFYTVPLGLMLLGLLIIGGVIFAVVSKSDDDDEAPEGEPAGAPPAG